MVSMDSFNNNTYLWEKKKPKDFRNNRLREYVKLDNIKTTKQDIAKRQKVKDSFDYLDKL